MQWDSSENAGFTKGTPWIKVNPNYTEINAEKQLSEPESVFACYKKLIWMRKHYDVIVDGRFELLLPDDEQFFAYTRENASEKMYFICNFYGNEAVCPLDEPWENMELLYCNYSETETENVYRPYEARIYYMTKR
jgi:glucan 1,6-alpha-glucosidase